MSRWLRSLFAWREVRNTGVHSYQVNGVTGERRVLRVMAGGYQPVDGRWMQTGEWEDAPHVGPRPAYAVPLRGWHAERSRLFGVVPRDAAFLIGAMVVLTVMVRLVLGK